ncbi:MAG: SbmA/BacA-like family transporter, partial [Candidatus Binatia bacterium]
MSEDGKRDDVTRRYLLRRFWRSGAAFWRRGGPATARLLTGGLLVMLLVQVGLQYGLNVWNRNIFDALEKKDGGAVFHQSLVFPLLAVFLVVAGVAIVYLRMTIQRRWRRWLTNEIIDRWLAAGRYYQLNLVKGDHQNPEFRIADDMRIATESPIDFATGILAASLSALTFIVVLWTIGGSASFAVGGMTVTIPGFLVVAAIVYAIVASGSMVVVGRRFVSAAEAKNQAEAEYRYALTRVRENGESIALLGGEEEERAGLDRSLHQVLRRWRGICMQQMRTSVVSLSSAVLAPVVPLLLTAPK